MIELLVGIIIALLLLWIVVVLLNHIGVGEPIRTVVLIAIVIALLLYMTNRFGLTI